MGGAVRFAVGKPPFQQAETPSFGPCELRSSMVSLCSHVCAAASEHKQFNRLNTDHTHTHTPSRLDLGWNSKRADSQKGEQNHRETQKIRERPQDMQKTRGTKKGKTQQPVTSSQ
jgi:hypothetical protein